MAQNKPILYSYFRSSCSWRVRIALAFKNIDYEYKAVNLLKGEQLQEEFLKINPSAEVPAFVHNGNVITHSIAILEYLEEAFPSPQLLPNGPVSRAKVRALVDSIVSDIQPIQNLRVLKYVGEKHLEWGKYWIETGFAAVERYIKDIHGLYCFGNEVTLADLCLVPQVFNAARFNVDVSQFPLITEITSRLSELPAFKHSHPLVQPDCPDELRKPI